MVWSGGEGLDGRPRPVSLAPTLEHPHPRATMKAHPSTPRRPRPYGSPGLLPDFPTEVDANWGRLAVVLWMLHLLSCFCAFHNVVRASWLDVCPASIIVRRRK